MSELTDDQLILQYLKHSDLQAMTEIFLRYQNSAFRTALLTCGNEADAEDAVQVSFLKFMNECVQYKAGLSLKAYLMKIVVNTCKDKYKSEKRRSRRQNVISERRAVYMVNNADSAIDQQHHFEKVKVVLEKLPNKYHESIAMIYLEGFSYSEAAEILNIPEKTIRTQVTRGIDRIRELLSDQKITLNSLAIISILQKEPLQKASVKLQENCMHLAFRNQSKLSQLKEYKVLYFHKIFPIVILIILICVLSVLFYKLKVQSLDLSLVNSNESISISNNKQLLKPFDYYDREFYFEDSEEVNVISKSKGLHWLEKGGIQNSSCILFNDYILIKLPYKESDLPITVFYKSNPAQSESEGGFSHGSFSSVDEGYFLAGLASMIHFKIGRDEFYAQKSEDWIQEEFIFDKNGVEVYKNGELKNVCVSNYIKSDYLLVWANHKSKIDNLKIFRGGKLNYENFYKEWFAQVQKKKNTNNYYGNFDKKFILSAGLKGQAPVFQLFDKCNEGEVEKMLFNTKKIALIPKINSNK